MRLTLNQYLRIGSHYVKSHYKEKREKLYHKNNINVKLKKTNTLNDIKGHGFNRLTQNKSSIVPHELYPISLPSGNYLLTGEKDGDRKVFKFRIN